MLILIYFIKRGTDSKFEWSFYDRGGPAMSPEQQLF